MQRDKKITQFAKKLVRLSKDGDLVTEAKVGEVLAALKQAKPRHLGAILKTYLRYIKREVAAQTALVATPGALGTETLEALETHFSDLYQRTVRSETRDDASLIAGVRVRVGDDVYDASVAGRLERLAAQVH
jgi:F-type H+-transporting ATPase subunit delta